jgi:hypothetical protein
MLSCARDEKFIVGYAPDVELTRTTTIMQGGACCGILLNILYWFGLFVPA